MKTINYWWVVAGRLIAWAWGHVLESALIGIAVFAIGSFIQYKLSGTYPSLKQTWEEFMVSLSSLVVFGVFAVLAVVAICFVIGLFFVPPQIHSEQLEALNEARKELIAATDLIKTKDEIISSNRPQLAMEAKSFFTATMSTSSHPDFPFVGLYIVLRNKGGPSIAENWEVRAVFPDGRVAIGENLFFTGDIDIPLGTNLDGSPIAKKIDKGNSIINRTNTPLANGAQAFGWLPLMFKDVSNSDELHAAGIKFVVECNDIHGVKCTLVYAPDPKNKLTDGGLFVLPGET